MGRPDGGWISGYTAPTPQAARGVWSLRDSFSAQRLSNWPVTPLVPSSVSGLRLWLDGTDSATLFDATTGGSAVAAGGSIARWEDKSTNATHATQATSTRRPTRQTNVRNGKDVVRLNGTSHTMQISSVTLPTFVTVFVAASTTGTVKLFMEHSASALVNDGMWFAGAYSEAWAFTRSGVGHTGPSTDGTDWIGSGWAIATLAYNGTGRIFKNGTLDNATTRIGTARSNTNVTAALNIGSRNQTSLYLPGDLAHVIIYDGVLSTPNRLGVEQWLRDQMAITG